MSQTPTDPVKELIEAAEKATPGPWKTEFNEKHGLCEYDVFSSTPHYQFVACHPSRISNPIAANMQFIVAARNCIPALTALVNEREKVRALVAEIRSKADQTTSQQFKLRIAYEWCANRLAAILDPQSVKDSDRLDIPAFLRRGDD